MRSVALCLGLLATAAAADPAAEGHAWITARIADFNAAQPRLDAPALARQVVDTAADVDAFGARVMGDYLSTSLSDFAGHLRRDEFLYFAAVARQRVVAALGDRLVSDLAAVLESGAVGEVSLDDARFDHDRGRVVLHTSGPAAVDLTCHLKRDDQGRWHLVDLDIDGRSLSARYQRRFHDTLKGRYSPAVLVSQLRDLDYISLEDFSGSTPGGLPVGWRWRDRDEHRRKPYQVAQREGHYYLAANDSGGSVILLRFAHWNPRDYPIMTWCWRADALPAGGDERFGHTNDSAAGIYVIFSQNWIGMPRHIKYVWSSTLPIGTVGRRDRIGRPYFVVVDSGSTHLGQWRFARANLLVDYGKTYGGRPRKRTEGLGLLTDANSTDSRALAYYADLRVWRREAWEAGRIRDHCDCFRRLDLPPAAGTAGQPAQAGSSPHSGITP